MGFEGTGTGRFVCDVQNGFATGINTGKDISEEGMATLQTRDDENQTWSKDCYYVGGSKTALLMKYQEAKGYGHLCSSLVGI